MSETLTLPDTFTPLKKNDEEPRCARGRQCIDQSSAAIIDRAAEIPEASQGDSVGPALKDQLGCLGSTLDETVVQATVQK